MSEYLTIKEACRLTGKSDKTIRRNIIDDQDKHNLTSHDQVVTKQNNRYLILKSFLIEFYNLDTSANVQAKTSQMSKSDQAKSNQFSNFDQAKPSQMSKSDQVEPSQNKELLAAIRSQLEDTKEQVVFLKSQIENKDITITEQLKQADQSQRLIAQLQQTNSALLLEAEPPVEVKPKTADEIKKEGSWWWMVVSLILIFGLALGIYYVLNK